jgi:Fe2+ or Zn2+ uptake regulation protein
VIKKTPKQIQKQSPKKHTKSSSVKTLSGSPWSGIFKVCGIKATVPRSTVLEVFSQSPKPLSAEDVFKIIHKKTGKMPDIVTIYRTIDVFLKNGFLSKVSFRDKVNRYEFSNGHDHHCHHAICESCGETEHIDDPEIEKALEVLARKFKKVKDVKDHTLEFFGTCSSCKNHKKMAK